MRRHWIGWIGVLLVGVVARGDEFERIEGDALTAAARSKAGTVRTTLTFGDLEALPNILRDSRAAFLVVTTDQGNIARLLVSPALRKPPRPTDPALPVMVVDRFDTFESGNIATRLAHGKDVILFEGFQLDLDSGQIVPEGQGGDVKFLVKGGGGPRLVALGTSAFHTFSKALSSGVAASRRPTIGRAVVPGDFAGRYRLYANGQWSGTLDLNVDPAGVVAGRFRSDLNGASYAVSGQVGPEVPQKIGFRVAYPRTHQDFEGLIWTEGKGAMAGTLTMLDRSYGFFAIREGGRFAPDGEDVSPIAKGDDRPGRKTVTLRKGQYTLAGQPKTDQEVVDTLKRAVTAEPSTWVLLQVPDDETFSAINHALETLSSSGVASIRLAPAD